MAMTLECAYYIVRTHHRVVRLIEAANMKGAPAEDVAYLREKRDRLGLFVPAASALVIAHTDSEFGQLAAAMKADTDKIDAAIADINKINQAVTSVANIINKISGLLGVVL